MYGPGRICVVVRCPAGTTSVVDVEVELGGLDKMRAEDTLQQLRVHVLIKDVHVTQTVTAEAGPCTDFGRMRILVDAGLRIQRLSFRPSHEYSTPKSLAPEDLLVGKYDIHPFVGRPVL